MSADLARQGAALSSGYTFHGHVVRRVTVRGQKCFVARDCGIALDYGDSARQFVKDLTSEWSGEIRQDFHWFRLRGDELRAAKATVEVVGTGPTTQDAEDLAFVPELVVLTEAGLNLALMKSGKPKAVEFRLWLAHDVVPDIIHTGKYDPERAPSRAMDAKAELELFVFRQQSAIGLYLQASSLYDPEFLRHKVEHSVALITGERPAIADPLLDVSAYLLSKGVSRDEVKRRASSFGKKVKAAYIAERGKEPGKLPRDVNGGSREVCCYTERDRPIFDVVFANMFMTLTAANDGPSASSGTAA